MISRFFLMLTNLCYIQCLPTQVENSIKGNNNVFVEELLDKLSAISLKGNETTRQVSAEDVIHWQRGSDSYGVAFDGWGDTIVMRRSLRSSIAEPWPLPYAFESTHIFLRLDVNNFTIYDKLHSCDIIDEAIVRYNRTIFEDSIEISVENYFHAPKSKIKDEMEYEKPLHFNDELFIQHVNIHFDTPCSAFPAAESDESYRLTISGEGIKLLAKEVWGVIRGLETMSQLVVQKDGKFYIRQVTIRDKPRFKYRGLLLDTARHYIKKEVIFDVLEGMAQSKMNVLHWHMVDDQSFPYQSEKFPELSQKGAYHPSMVYTKDDINDIIEFARLRGIRIIPEFDMPGHAYSWGLSLPELLTQCHDETGNPIPGYMGPMDPSSEYVFHVLFELFRELLTLFKDSYVHLGNDEVLTDCWASNPKVAELFLKIYKDIEVRKLKTSYQNLQDTKAKERLDIEFRLLNRDIRTMSVIERNKLIPKYVWQYFIERVRKLFKKLELLREKKMEFIIWEDALGENVTISNDTIIQVWKTDHNLRRLLLKGYRVIYSYCWYLDRLSPGVHWHKYYQCDLSALGRFENDQSLLGGEVCLWGEFMSNEMLMQWLWPRASAAAERLWSQQTVQDLFSAARRLSEQRCRMLRRGLNVGIANGPEFCLRKAGQRKANIPTRSSRKTKLSTLPKIGKLGLENHQTVTQSYGNEFLIPMTLPALSTVVVLILIARSLRRNTRNRGRYW